MPDIAISLITACGHPKLFPSTSGPHPACSSSRAAAAPAKSAHPQVLLLLMQQGSNGLNLTEAQHVVLVEPSLNPAVEAQAVGRVDRIGQTRATHVHRCDSRPESQIFLLVCQGWPGRCSLTSPSSCLLLASWVVITSSKALLLCHAYFLHALDFLPAPKHAQRHKKFENATALHCTLSGRFVVQHTIEENVHRLCQQRAAAMDLSAASGTALRSASAVHS